MGLGPERARRTGRARQCRGRRASTSTGQAVPPGPGKHRAAALSRSAHAHVPGKRAQEDADADGPESLSGHAGLGAARGKRSAGAIPPSRLLSCLAANPAIGGRRLMVPGPRGPDRIESMTEAASKPRRRWSRSSRGFASMRLRTFFFAVAIIAVPLSWYARQFQLAHSDRTIIAAMERTGATVGPVDSRQSSWVGRLVFVDPLDIPLHVDVDKGGALASIDRLRNVESVVVGFSSITDADLFHLRNLTALRELHIRANPITDIGVGYLSNLTSLRAWVLNASSSEI